MDKNLRIFILAYPDNPVGYHFIKAFLRADIRLTGVILETGAGGGLKKRIMKKIQVDGLKRTIYRLFQVNLMRVLKQNIGSLAGKNGIEVFNVRKFNSKECRLLLQKLEVDLLVIASAPILKKYIFEQASLGCLNAHPGWLPKYRGLGANANALKNGEKPGVTVHFIDSGIDTGSIITRERIPIKCCDTVAKINDRAVARGAVLMTEVIQEIQSGTLEKQIITEPIGENYLSLPFKSVKLVNRKIRRMRRTQ